MPTDADILAVAREGLEIAGKATPGPWYINGEEGVRSRSRRRYVGQAMTTVDEQFIAHAGTHYAALCRAVIALAEERDKLTRAYARLVDELAASHGEPPSRQKDPA